MNAAHPIVANLVTIRPVVRRSPFLPRSPPISVHCAWVKSRPAAAGAAISVIALLKRA